MTTEHNLILKDDGFPVSARLEGAMARIIAPANLGTWVCLQMHTVPQESQEVQDQLSEFLPPEKFQLAISPDHAHALGMYLIEKAKLAVAPD